MAMARYKASAMKPYTPKRKPQVIPVNRYFNSIEAVPSKVKQLLKRYKAEFKYRAECPLCGENALLVFEDYSGTIETCVNPECTLYNDINYYPSSGGQ